MVARSGSTSCRLSPDYSGQFDAFAFGLRVADSSILGARPNWDSTAGDKLRVVLSRCFVPGLGVTLELAVRLERVGSWAPGSSVCARLVYLLVLLANINSELWLVYLTAATSPRARVRQPCARAALLHCGGACGGRVADQLARCAGPANSVLRPTSLASRRAVAERMLGTLLCLAPLPLCVDDLDDALLRALAAWPIRPYVRRARRRARAHRPAAPSLLRAAALP